MNTLSPLVFDNETTITNKGNPYTKENKLCYVGTFDGQEYVLANILRDPTSMPYNSFVQRHLVAFNAKFDLAWLKRYNVDFSSCTLHDCQLAHFLLTGQKSSYPSLNDVCEYYELGSKLDIVKLEYWDKGVDTDNIPPEILEEYLTQDLKLTWEVYQKQMKDFEKNPQLYKLFQLQCEDLFTLLEMEWNGIVVDIDSCNKEAELCEGKIKEIEKNLAEYHPDVPVNYSSGDDVSALLYGGTITHETRFVVGVYKSGIKEGQPRHKIVKYEFKLPGYFKPVKGSELKKEGYYSVDEATLSQLKGNAKSKKLLDLLSERSKLEKLRGTYYVGIPAKMKEINSFDGLLHGQFNQVVAKTGRLSSSQPNLQNTPPELNLLLISRYATC